MAEKAPIGLSDIQEDVRDSVSRQEYGAKSQIDGVQMLPLPTFVEDGGSFTELGRLANGALAGLEGFEVRQVNCSLMAAGAIKAWHLHFKQEDLWFVPPSQNLVVGLWDVRELPRPQVTRCGLSWDAVAVSFWSSLAGWPTARLTWGRRRPSSSTSSISSSMPKTLTSAACRTMRSAKNSGRYAPDRVVVYPFSRGMGLRTDPISEVVGMSPVTCLRPTQQD